MKKLILLFAVLLAFACSPCKYVSKHPECFRPDTVKQVSVDVRYEKEYITQDSVVYQKIPCDPETKVQDVPVVYKTIYKTKVDSIYRDKSVDRINPLNEKLKSDNEDLTETIHNRRWLLWYFIGTALIGIGYLALKIYKM